MKNKSNENESSRAFKWFHATSMPGGAMIISAVIASYFATFMTDTMLLPAGVCSIIMLVATLWDAINDPIMGVIADHTNTRWGRYRPYFLVAPILLFVFSTLLWLNPNFSQTGKIAWVLVMYIGWGMTVTLYTMPHGAILPACVKSNGERNKIVSMGAGCTALAFAIGSTVPSLSHTGYIPIMVVCNLLACISFWGLFGTAKEKYIQKPEEVQKGTLLKVLKHYELIPYILIWILASISYGLMFSSSVYYITYVTGKPQMIGLYMAIISVGAFVSMAVLMPIFLKVFNGGHKALMASSIGSIICYAVLFFFGQSSLSFLFVMTFVATAVASMSNALTIVLVNDAIDYVRLKDGFYANGVIASIKGFAQKCGTTVVSSGLLAVLAASGYVPNQPQSERALNAINFVRFGAPALVSVLIIICLLFNPVEKVKDQIQKMKEELS